MRYLSFAYKISKATLALSVLIVWGFIPYITNQGSSQSPATTIDATNSVVSGGTNTAKPGDTIEWRKSYDLSRDVERSNGIFVEKINTNHVFAGNLELPKGWSAEYSNSPKNTAPGNRVFQTFDTTPDAYTEQELSQMNFLRIDTGETETTKPSASTALLNPPDSYELDFAEEGYISNVPVYYKDKIYMVFNGVRAAPDKKQLDCFDLILYQRCENFPTYISSGSLELGAGTMDISTSIDFQIVQDESRIYFPGQKGGDFGVVCFDMEALMSCGFTIMGTTTLVGNGRNPTIVNGFVREGNKIYGHANAAGKAFQTMLCFDLETDAICDGYDSNTLGPATLYNITFHGNSYNTSGNHLIQNGKLYWDVDYRFTNSNILGFAISGSQRDFGTRLYCFDVVARATCEGYNRPVMFSAGFFEKTTSMYFYKETSFADPTHICVIASESNQVTSIADPSELCYDVNTGAFDNTTSTGMFPAQWLFVPWNVSPHTTTIVWEDGHERTYFPIYRSTALLQNFPETNLGGTICFDWTTQQRCEGFGNKTTFPPDPITGERAEIWTGIRYWYDVAYAQSSDIGYFYDGTCMWGMAKTGHIWSWEPDSTITPCRTASTENTVSLEEEDFYCDGLSHVNSWGKARLTQAKMFDFQEFVVTIRDPDTNEIIKQQNIKQSGSEGSILNLNDVAYQDNRQLKVEVEALLFNTSPWANGNTPYLGLTANADAAQYCYETKVPVENCDVDNVVTNSLSTIDITNDTVQKSFNNSINVVQEPDKQCFRDLKVSLSANKSTIRENETITYELTVTNQANPDPEQRGNITGAAFNVTIPEGLEYVSSTQGGSVFGNKVVWSNRSVSAAQVVKPTVTFRLKPFTVSQNTDQFRLPFEGVAYAAEQQQPLTVQASAVYNGEYFQPDNTATNSGVVAIYDVPEEEPVVIVDPTEPDDENPPAELPTDTDGEESPEDPDAVGFLPTDEPNDTGSSETPVGDRDVYTPAPLQGIVPAPAKEQVELFFNTLYGIVTPIPKGVALAIPYITITFLGVFALIYALLITKEGENKRKLRRLKKRFEQTEEARKDYINIVSHYLNTPIATMKLTLESIMKSSKIPKATAAGANEALTKIVEHSENLINQNETKAKSEKTQKTFTKPSAQRLLSFDLVAIIVGVLVLTVIVNLIFIWADSYDASTTLIATQSMYFALAFGLFVTAYRSFRHTKYANDVVAQEFAYEQELAETQSRFIANASTVLSRDITELDTFTTTISSAPRTKPYVESIQSLKEITGRLIAINSLVTKQRLSSAVGEDIGEMVKGVVKALQPKAEAKLIEMSMFIEPNLKTDIDREDIEIVTSSVIDNAIKFNEEGGGVEVIVKNKNEKFVTMIIKDTGTGIPKDKIDTLFAPFSRATGTLEFNYEGVGLDLYTVKLTVEHYGGTIRIESEEDKGTTVYIELPLL